MRKKNYIVRLCVNEEGEPLSMHISDASHGRSRADFHAEYNRLTLSWDILHDEMQEEGVVDERCIAQDRTFDAALRVLLSVTPKAYAVPVVELVFPEGFP
jgi:hypothetical protein